MKTAPIRGILFLACMLTANLAVAQTAGAQASGDGREADHAALRALMADVTRAINAQDMNALAARMAERFSFTTADQQILKDIPSVRAYLDRMVNSEDSPLSGYSIAPSPEAPTVFLDDKTGCCCGVSDDIYIVRKGERKIHVKSRWTATVVKQGEQWKVAAVHVGVDFLENPVLQIRTLSWWRKILLAVGIGKYPGEE